MLRSVFSDHLWVLWIYYVDDENRISWNFGIQEDVLGFLGKGMGGKSSSVRIWHPTLFGFGW